MAAKVNSRIARFIPRLAAGEFQAEIANAALKANSL